MKTSRKAKSRQFSKSKPHIFSFRRLKISKQIFVAFSIVIILSLILLIFNVWSTNQISKINEQLAEVYAYRSTIADMTSLTNQGRLLADFLRRISQSKLQLQVKDDIQIATNISELQENAADLNTILQEFSPAKISELQTLVNKLSDTFNTWRNDKSDDSLFTIATTMTEYQYFTHELSYALKRQINNQFRVAETHIQVIRIINLLLNAVIPVFLLIIIIPLLYNLKGLFNPVRQAADNAVQGATNAFEYAAQINESIAELKHVLIDISRSIGDVSKGAQDSSIQAEKIISSIQVTSDLTAELGEIANTVYKSLDSNQSNLQEKIDQVKQLSENVSESLLMINQNADIAANLAKQVTNLEEQMNGINSFLVAMGEITEQTNLLALNASIEAARAEEHGKGFAVVAERIRNLSDETKNFTSQIKNTVTGIKAVANEVAGALNNIITAVRSSASEVSEVTQEFSNLKDVLQSLYSSNTAILQAADLQLDGTKQIHSRSIDVSKAVENITAQTEQVSASMEELAASSEEITAQIELIHGKVAETQQVVERQLEIVKLTKETTEQI